MKKIIALLAFATLLTVFTSCEADKKYENRLAELKDILALPTDAVVIKELGVSDNSSIWCVFALNGDTMLLHYYHKSGNSEYRESMCRMSSDQPKQKPSEE